MESEWLEGGHDCTRVQLAKSRYGRRRPSGSLIDFGPVFHLLVRLIVDAFLDEQADGFVEAFRVITVARNYHH